MYDVRNGCMFSTYAMKSIKRTLSRYVNSYDKLIRLPFHVEALGYKMKKFNESFFCQFGYYPNEKDIALEFGLTEKFVYEMKKALNECNYLSFNCNIAADIDDEKNSELGDFVVDRKVNVEDEVVNNEYFKYLFDAIDTKLTEKQKFVILERLKGRTLKSIGEDINVTKEYIRQVEKSAIKKLQRVSGIRG